MAVSYIVLDRLSLYIYSLSLQWIRIVEERYIASEALRCLWCSLLVFGLTSWIWMTESRKA
jgi:accessory gene regulator protein AgrB